MTTPVRQCTFYVGDAPVNLQVPLDFETGFEEAFIAEYFPQEYFLRQTELIQKIEPVERGLAPVRVVWR